MNILKQSLAPITSEAWEEINDQAIKVFKNVLTARKFVDIDGPKGLDYAAVPLGRLKIESGSEENGVNYGIHKILPLIELRKPFELDLWELDNISRGAEDPDLEPLEEAAHEIARFEEKAVFYGFQEANIQGLREKSAFEEKKFPENAEELLKLLGKLTTSFHNKAVEGPYALVVGADKWAFISSYQKGYPLSRHIENILGGPVIQNPNIKDSFLVSTRGEDFKLTIGQDMSIGYDSADTEKVKLYFTESFTFRVLEPNACISLIS